MLTLAYVALAVLGCVYVVFAAFTGHAGHGDGGHGDAGHVDGGHAGHDSASADYGVSGGGHGHTHAGESHGAGFHFPFFSPLALATLFASVGAWGLIAKFGLHASDPTSIAIAVPAAFITAYAVTYLSWRLVTSSVGSSEIRLSQLEGAEGEVITPIPKGGLGEVAAHVGNQRFTSSAREADGGELPRGAFVRVVRMVGHTLVVRADKPAAASDKAVS